jgi:hypothetical protein
MRVALNLQRQKLQCSHQALRSFGRTQRWYATQSPKGGRPFACTWLTNTPEDIVSQQHPFLVGYELNYERHQMISYLVFLQYHLRMPPIPFLSSWSPRALPTGSTLAVLSCHNV